MKAVFSQRVESLRHLGYVDCLERNYIVYALTHGLVPYPMPNIGKGVGRALIELGCQRIVLTGGNDVSPSLYGGVIPSSNSCSSDRDDTETALLQYAVEYNVPVLGICRGMQFINVFFGGTLSCDDAQLARSHIRTEHRVKLLPANLESPWPHVDVTVNSFHSYFLREADLAEPLTAFAIAADETIEAIHHPTLPIAGIMWHPERRDVASETDETLITAFVEGEGFWRQR